MPGGQHAQGEPLSPFKLAEEAQPGEKAKAQGKKERRQLGEVQKDEDHLPEAARSEIKKE